MALTRYVSKKDIFASPLLVLEFNSSLQRVGEIVTLFSFPEDNIKYTYYGAQLKKETEGMIPFNKIIDDLGIKTEALFAKEVSEESLSPLFYMVNDGGNLYTYSYSISHHNELLFLNSNENVKQKIAKETELRGLIEIAFKNHQRNAYPLNNYIAIYNKFEPDYEVEYKINFEPTNDIWMLHRHFITALKKGLIPDFSLNLIHGLRRWIFKNYLYEVVAPKSERGYISFIANPDGSYVLKHKIYPKDQLKRVELRNKSLKFEGSMENYLAVNYPKLTFKKHPMFTRIFYSFVMDSLKSGNNYAVIFDRNYIEGSKFKPLSSCEIEYFNTSRIGKMVDFGEEIIEVKEIFKKHLDFLSIKYKETFYSKLSYLQDFERNDESNLKI